MENREHFGTLTERMHSFREELLNTEASIDATRAVLATQAYQEHADKPLASASVFLPYMQDAQRFLYHFLCAGQALQSREEQTLSAILAQLQEAQKYGKANKIASSEDKTFSYIPDCSDLPISPDADYVYICENNTIYGTKFKKLPNTKGKTLVADVSSCFLSEPVDVSKYGIIYGGVQKNIGPAGMVISIIREDLITDDVLEGTPTMLKFKTQADAGSLYNTPNCYCIYVCGKVFKWLKKMGGLEEMKKRNEEKAKILYDFLDSSKLFHGTVVPKDRSLMNVPFVTGDKEMDAKFVAEAAKAGLVNLKGHRTVGGMRASIYNAMPKAGVEALVAFMKKFEEENA